MIVFVTGATAGFGAEITRRFLREGHKVIAVGRRAERLQSLRDEFPGAPLHTPALDVCDRKAVESLVESLQRNSPRWMCSSTMRDSPWASNPHTRP